MIAGAIKTFRFDFDYVVYEMSFANLLLLSAAVPGYHTQEEKDKIMAEKRGKGRSRLREGEAISADDPANSERIRLIFNEFK